MPQKQAVKKLHSSSSNVDMKNNTLNFMETKTNQIQRTKRGWNWKENC